MSQDSNNSNKDKKMAKENKDSISTNPSQYTFDSSEDVKEIMTGRSGEGEGEGTPYPDSDKHLVEDIKKVVKNTEEKDES